MPDKARKLAEQYLQKYKVAEDQFGLGPFLDREKFELFAAPKEAAGSLVITSESNFEDVYFGCKTISEKVAKTIQKNNPELKPQVVYFHDKGIHYWVEITNPVTKEIIQIDPNPWFSCLNPGHHKEENCTHHEMTFLLVTKRFGRPFSIKKYGTKFISVYFCAHLPRLTKEEGYSTDKNTNLPEYRFKLIAVIEKYFGAVVEKMLTLYVNVVDASQLQDALLNTDSLEELAHTQAIEFGFTYKEQVGFTKNTPFQSIKAMASEAHKNGDDELFTEIEKNLPRLITLLKKVKPTLAVHKKEREYVDVKSGEYI